MSALIDEIGSEVIGIDLGTTNSAVAVFKYGFNGADAKPEVLTNFQGILFFLCVASPDKIQVNY